MPEIRCRRVSFSLKRVSNGLASGVELGRALGGIQAGTVPAAMPGIA